MGSCQVSRLASNNEESQSLMDKDIELQSPQPKYDLRRTVTFTRIYLLITHIAIILLVGLLWSDRHRTTGLLAAKSSWCTSSLNMICQCNLLTYGKAPVDHLIEYEISTEHVIDNGKHSQYSGPPSEDNNRAWEELMRRQLVSTLIIYLL